MLIYIVTNEVNQKKYVGQTVGSLSRRKSGHISNAKCERDNTYFHRAIRKYGPDSFIWTILHDDITEIEDLNRLEIFYIGYYDTFENGYNLTEGGSNAIPTEEIRRSISVANKGRKLSENTKRRISESHKGIKPSDEIKRKLSELRKGRYTGKDNYMYGRKHSPESLKKMSENSKGKNIGVYTGKNSPNATPIVINGKYFYTRDDAAKFIGVGPATIRRRILHKTKWLGYIYVNI